jgi:hypothetical protein
MDAIGRADIWIGYHGADEEQASEGGDRRVCHVWRDDRAIQALHVNMAVFVAHPIVDVD